MRSWGRKVGDTKRNLPRGVAVGDCVGKLLDQGRRPAAKAIDLYELPQRTGAIERIGSDQGGKVEQLAHRAGFGEGDVPYVEAQIEVAVIDPHR